MSGQDQSPQGLWVDTVRRSGRLLAAAPCVPCSNGRHSICWGDLNAVCPCPACTEWSKRSPFGRPPNEEVDR